MSNPASVEGGEVGCRLALDRKFSKHPLPVGPQKTLTTAVAERKCCRAEYFWEPCEAYPSGCHNGGLRVVGYLVRTNRVSRAPAIEASRRIGVSLRGRVPARCDCHSLGERVWRDK